MEGGPGGKPRGLPGSVAGLPFPPMHILVRAATIAGQVIALVATSPRATTAQSATGQPAASAGDPHARSQAAAPAAPAARWAIGAGAVGVVTRAMPAFDGRDFTEGYLTQPAVMGVISVPRLHGLEVAATINLEGLTLRRGELNAGIYGEGYVDRRHPHTLIHELVASIGGSGVPGGGPTARWSLAAGRGFVPFGSDDPMSRPFVKFPLNHHLAQILERYVTVAGVRVGPAMVEVAAFNGDEPVSPYDMPSLSRFGDSFAARATVLPAPWLELSASGAAVASPEHADGEGLDQRKLHVGARAERGGRGAEGWRYALAEYARTDDRSRGRLAHYYESLLVEGGAGWRGWEVALRGERSDRPEEQRLLNPFRSPRPHGDGSVLGVTRWSVASAAIAHRGSVGGVELRPFVEASYLHAGARSRPAAFEPAAFYGRDRMWSLSAGLGLSWGMRHARMGRYGVAAAGPRAHPDHATERGHGGRP